MIQILYNKLKTASIVIITHKARQINSNKLLRGLEKNKKDFKKTCFNKTILINEN